MGEGQSRPRFKNPALLKEPWKNKNWGNKQTDLQDVKNLKPPAGCEKIRILLHGPTGAGKSSFINSVQSVLRGRMSAMALVDNTSGDSFTKTYKTYKIQKGPESFYPFVFNDIMGLEDKKGVLVDDIKMALKGHMKEGYKFNPESRLSVDDPQYYNSFPDHSDKVHVLVCVVPADTASSLTDETVRKIREIRREASELGIPQVVLFTKVDRACPKVKKDFKIIYKVKNVKEQMEKFSAEMGVPMNCIFPVKNYSEENALNDDVDLLILNALKKIITCGEDFINLTMS